MKNEATREIKIFSGVSCSLRVRQSVYQFSSSYFLPGVKLENLNGMGLKFGVVIFTHASYYILKFVIATEMETYKVHNINKSRIGEQMHLWSIF
jgi:hypothetical protein